MEVPRAESSTRRKPSQTHSSTTSNNPLDISVPTPEEMRSIWYDDKFLRFGMLRVARREPYVSRDEYVDPLVMTSPAEKVPCAYYRNTADKGPLATSHPFGFRRAPMHARKLPAKVTSHNPNVAPVANSDAHAASSRVHRLPLTPLLEDVEERLKLFGCGSIVDVRGASDEAVSKILQAIGIPAQQRMTVLWELRRRFPL